MPMSWNLSKTVLFNSSYVITSHHVSMLIRSDRNAGKKFTFIRLKKKLALANKMCRIKGPVKEKTSKCITQLTNNHKQSSTRIRLPAKLKKMHGKGLRGWGWGCGGQNVCHSNGGLVLSLSQFLGMTETPQKNWSLQKWSKVTQQNILGS